MAQMCHAQGPNSRLDPTGETPAGQPSVSGVSEPLAQEGPWRLN